MRWWQSWLCCVALLGAGLLLSSCTFSDSLRHDDIRSVWAPPDNAVAHPSVIFVTDRQPDGSRFGYGLHWDSVAHCGVSRLSIPAAFMPGAVPHQADAEPPQPLGCDTASLAGAMATAARSQNCNSVLLIVHGFNTTFRTALLRAGQVATDTRWPCLAALFSWSSEGKFDRYVADIERSGYSVPLLIATLRAMDAAGLRVNIFAESMGARVALSAVAASCAEHTARIADEVILAAPDVSAEHDNDDFDHLLGRGAPCVRRATIYASDNDMALIASESLHGGVPRAGRVPDKDRQYAEREYGDIVDVVDTSRAPGDPFGHGYFVLSYEMMSDTMQVLAGLPVGARAAPDAPGGPTLTCAGGSACAADRGRYALAVTHEREPDWTSRIVRHLWPLVFPIQ